MTEFKAKKHGVWTYWFQVGEGYVFIKFIPIVGVEPCQLSTVEIFATGDTALIKTFVEILVLFMTGVTRRDGDQMLKDFAVPQCGFWCLMAHNVNFSIN
jgi:hypothetical protein